MSHPALTDHEIVELRAWADGIGRDARERIERLIEEVENARFALNEIAIHLEGLQHLRKLTQSEQAILAQARDGLNVQENHVSREEEREVEPLDVGMLPLEALRSIALHSGDQGSRWVAQKALDRPPTSGVDLIAAERQRQIEEEGYSLAHDLTHGDELVLAAKAYITTDPRDWPWSGDSFKPSLLVRRNLIKAGALIAAAIDSLDAKR